MAWGLATTLTLLLLVHIFSLNLYRTYPLFTVYLCLNLLQTGVGFYSYQSHGFATTFSYWATWISQAFIVVARGLAAAGVCYLILGKFKGVWALAVRLLIVCASIALIAALCVGAKNYKFAVITLEMSLEAFIATWVVGLLLFVRYYGVRVLRGPGMVGLGLGLLSCSKLLNDLVFEKYVQAYKDYWNYVSLAAFVVILVLWIWGIRKPVTQAVGEPRLNPAELYWSLIPQVNRNLLELNQQLSRFWDKESPKA